MTEPTVAPVTPEPTATPVQPPAAEPIKTEPAEHMIPKSRLDEEIKKRADAEKELKKFQEAEEKRKQAEMTDLQKLQAENEKLIKQTKSDALDKLRRKVGEEVKLPAAIYELLPEGTEDEMKAKAKELAEALPKQQPGISATNPGPSGGTVTPDQRRAFLNGGPLPQ